MRQSSATGSELSKEMVRIIALMLFVITLTARCQIGEKM